jgi:hypothetical protein
LQVHRVNLHTGGGPVRGQLQALEFFAAVKQQAADTNVTQLNGNGQLQVRQLNRPTALFSARRDVQADLLHVQAIDAQGHAQQARR